MSMELEIRKPPAKLEALSVEDVKAQVQMIQHLMKEALQDGEHYGVIPGTNSKPTLLKPGAEKLCFMFRLDPEYPEEKLREVWLPDGNYIVTATCVLYHIDSGKRIASGLGLCSTKEEKYGLRNAERTCPDCQQAAIVRSVKKSAYFCIRDKGGCGNRFAFDSDKANELDSQEVGKKPNDRLADTYNTVLKMACKRALIAAVLNGTAASDIFTQDLDDADEPAADGPPVPAADAGAEGDAPEGDGSPVPQRDEPSPDLEITFGAYKGTRIGDLPYEYLLWLAGREPHEGTDPFVADDEMSLLAQRTAVHVLEGLDREARRSAINLLSSTFKRIEEHGSLPPGHENWAEYLKWYIEGKYEIDGSKWRTDLSPQQIQETAAYLAEYEIPL